MVCAARKKKKLPDYLLYPLFPGFPGDVLEPAETLRKMLRGIILDSPEFPGFPGPTAGLRHNGQYGVERGFEPMQPLPSPTIFDRTNKERRFRLRQERPLARDCCRGRFLLPPCRITWTAPSGVVACLDLAGGFCSAIGWYGWRQSVVATPR